MFKYCTYVMVANQSVPFHSYCEKAIMRICKGHIPTYFTISECLLKRGQLTVLQ